MKIFIFSLFVFFSNQLQAEVSQPMNSEDPFESYNRSIYQFNSGFNDIIGKPVADGYNSLPKPITSGVSNFFQNLKEPLNLMNAIFQGKAESSLNALMRFSVNSTLGLFGLLDIATEMGMEYKKEDLGQTLYVWGLWTEASFIMLPIVGPYTTRELIGSTVDSTYNPIYPYVIDTDVQGRALMFVGEKFVDYTKVVHLTDEMKKQADPYIFMRESYLQYRTNLIYDGNPPEPELDDFNFE